MNKMLKLVSRLLLLPVAAAGVLVSAPAQPANAAALPELTPVKLAAGYEHSMAIMEDGTLTGFGRAGHGQLGFGGTDVERLATPTQGLTDVVEVSGGDYHTMARKGDGTVWSWGSSSYGQLGYTPPSGIVNVTTPTQIPGLAGVTSIAAGYRHSLVVAGGQVYAWGNNEKGQLGNGTTSTSPSLVPQQVPGLSDVTAVEVGVDSSFALTSTGDLYAWGYNWNGRLGDGTIVDKLSPVKVLSGVKQVSSGNAHTLALMNDNTVMGWGSNGYGELSNAVASEVRQPRPLNISGATSVSAGQSFSLILLADKTGLSFGSNNVGQLGHGTTYSTVSTPTQIAGLTNIRQLVAGGKHALAMLEDGTVRAWGSNDYLQSGISHQTASSIPTKFYSPQTVYFMKASAFATGQTTIDLNFEGSDPSVVGRYVVKRWDLSTPLYEGLNNSYRNSGLRADYEYKYIVEMYDNVDTTKMIGQRIFTVRTHSYEKMMAGEYHTVYLKGDRRLSNFGFNAYGQLGDKSNTDKYSPFAMTTLIDAVDVAAGYGFTMAKKLDGTLWAWGQNHLGQLGNGTTTDSLTPVQINLPNVNKMASKYDHVLTVQSNGTVYGWGRNNFGELGLGNFTNQSTPQLVPNLTNVSDVKMGFGHSLILKTDGTVWAMGRNDQGQLGNGTTKGSTVAVQVPGLTGVKAIAAGSLHNLALKTDGTVWAWGYNKNGQLGNGLAGTNELTPKKITALTGVKEIAAGYGHSLALKTDGTVWGFGYNYNGQLGDGTRFNSAVPVQVQGITNASKLISGGINGYAELSDGSYRVWGGNSYGAYGDGTNNYSTTPVKMFGNAGLAVYATTDQSNSMYLAWKTVPAAGTTSPTASYKVYRDNTLIYQGANLNMTDTGLTAFTPYTYKVEALDSAGNLIETKTVVSATAQQLSMIDGMDGMENDFFTEEFYPLDVTGLEY